MSVTSIRNELNKLDRQYGSSLVESKNVGSDELSSTELSILDPNDPMFERHKQVMAHVKKHNPDLFQKMQNLE